MQERSLLLPVFIILCTLLPALVPSLFLIITNSHFTTQILTPTCYHLGQQSGQQVFNHQLCISYFQKGDYSSPFKLEIIESNSQLYSTPQTHKKRVIQINKKMEKLSSFLGCQDLFQMLDVKIPVLTFTDLSVDKINFQQDIASINQIITDANMSIQPSTEKQRILMQKSISQFAIIQLLKTKVDSSSSVGLLQSHVSQTDPLNQVRYLSNQYETNYLLLLNIFCKASIGLCFLAFALKRYFEKVMVYEIFASGTVVLGFLISFNDYKLETNNFYFITAELLFIGLCLNKVEVPKLIIMAYLVIQIIALLITTSSVLLQFLRIVFYLITAIIIFDKSRKSIENENACLFLTVMWSILTLFLIFDGCERSFVFVFAHSTILILSTSFVEFLVKAKAEQPGNVGGFTKIKHFQEMEQIVEQA